MHPLAKFVEVAHSKGYHEKVVGQFSYTKSRRVDSPRIKLFGARDGKIQVMEQNSKTTKYYEVEI